MKRRIVQTIATWLLLLAFTSLLRPDKLPVVLLIVPFVLLFAALYSSWNLLFALKDRFYSKTGVVAPRKRLGIAICTCAVLLLVLQSLGQLTFKDVVTLSAIVVLGYMYIARARIDAAKR
jgi:hypothetical protein